MGAYARRTFLASITLAGLLFVVAMVASVLVIGFEHVSAGFEAFILSWTSILASFVAATLYVVLRRKVLYG